MNISRNEVHLKEITNWGRHKTSFFFCNLQKMEENNGMIVNDISKLVYKILKQESYTPGDGKCQVSF